METNPYESPASEIGESAVRGFGRAIAVGLWLLDAVLTGLSVLALNSPPMIERFKEDGRLLVTVVIVGGVSPIVGIALLGVASWRRSWRTALFAGIVMLAPLVIFFVWHLVRRALAATQ